MYYLVEAAAKGDREKWLNAQEVARKVRLEPRPYAILAALEHERAWYVWNSRVEFPEHALALAVKHELWRALVAYYDSITVSSNPSKYADSCIKAREKVATLIRVSGKNCGKFILRPRPRWFIPTQTILEAFSDNYLYISIWHAEPYYPLVLEKLKTINPRAYEQLSKIHPGK